MKGLIEKIFQDKDDDYEELIDEDIQKQKIYQSIKTNQLENIFWYNQIFRKQPLTYQHDEDEQNFVYPLQYKKEMDKNLFVIYFNLSSLFWFQDKTQIQEQYLDQAKNVPQWVSKYDNKLVNAFKKYQTNWQKIEEEVNQINEKSQYISAKDCQQRIEKLSQSVKGTWSIEEDNLIIKYYKKYGRNWSLIANKIQGRSGKQI